MRSGGPHVGHSTPHTSAPLDATAVCTYVGMIAVIVVLSIVLIIRFCIYKGFGCKYFGAAIYIVIRKQKFDFSL